MLHLRIQGRIQKNLVKGGVEFFFKDMGSGGRLKAPEL